MAMLMPTGWKKEKSLPLGFKPQRRPDRAHAALQTGTWQTAPDNSANVKHLGAGRWSRWAPVLPVHKSDTYVHVYIPVSFPWFMIHCHKIYYNAHLLCVQLNIIFCLNDLLGSNWSVPVRQVQHSNWVPIRLINQHGHKDYVSGGLLDCEWYEGKRWLWQRRECLQGLAFWAVSCSCRLHNVCDNFLRIVCLFLISWLCKKLLFGDRATSYRKKTPLWKTHNIVGKHNFSIIWFQKLFADA